MLVYFIIIITLIVLIYITLYLENNIIEENTVKDKLFQKNKSKKTYI